MPSEPKKRCIICLDTSCSAATPQERSRCCCGATVCTPCLQGYINRAVESNQPCISCPSDSCSALVPSADCVALLKPGNFKRYSQAQVDNSKWGNKKTCPNCKHITPRPDGENGSLVECQNCQFTWCYRCHSPQHGSVSCAEYSKQSDAIFLMWTVESGSSGRTQRNARKCPGCGTYIQRGDGCRDMTCSGCLTQFCYDCGQKRPCACSRAGNDAAHVAPAKAPTQRPRNTVAQNVHGVRATGSASTAHSSQSYRMCSFLGYHLMIYYPLWMILNFTHIYDGISTAIRICYGLLGVFGAITRCMEVPIGSEIKFYILPYIVSSFTFTIPLVILPNFLSLCDLYANVLYTILVIGALLSDILVLRIDHIYKNKQSLTRSYRLIIGLVVAVLCFITALCLGTVAIVTTASNIQQLSYETTNHTCTTPSWYGYPTGLL